MSGCSIRAGSDGLPTTRPAPSSGVYDMDITISDGINPTTTVRHAEGAFYVTPNI